MIEPHDTEDPILTKIRDIVTLLRVDPNRPLKETQKLETSLAEQTRLAREANIKSADIQRVSQEGINRSKNLLSEKI